MATHRHHKPRVASEQQETCAALHTRYPGHYSPSSSLLGRQPHVLRVMRSSRALGPFSSTRVHPFVLAHQVSNEKTLRCTARNLCTGRPCVRQRSCLAQYAFHPARAISANSRSLPPSHWTEVPNTRRHPAGLVHILQCCSGDQVYFETPAPPVSRPPFAGRPTWV